MAWPGYRMPKAVQSLDGNGATASGDVVRLPIINRASRRWRFCQRLHSLKVCREGLAAGLAVSEAVRTGVLWLAPEPVDNDGAHPNGTAHDGPQSAPAGVLRRETW